ncbi:MAG: hypothetical protein IH876_14880 [Gemmatimonadetes bacterium]|nr:hypothetical protein [Gemmatimonadota bacterium]
MLEKPARQFAAALLATGLALGCSDSAGPDNDTLSDGEVSQVSAQVFAVTMAALNSPTTNGSPVLASSLASSVEAANGLASVPINFQYSSTHSCPVGGRAGANGSLTGSIDNQTGDGVLWLQIVFTYTDCAFSVGTRSVTINGNPSLTLNGTFTFLGGQPATQQTLSLSGALSTSVIPFCAISLTFTVVTAGNGTSTVSGTVCGRQVNS